MKRLHSVFVLGIALAASLSVSAQRMAVFTPDNGERSHDIAEKLAARLGGTLDVLDDSLAKAAYSSAPPETPFNLTTEESKRIGATVGCDFFILTKADTLRRSSFDRPEYYEAFAAIYLVSSRTGHLVLWRLPRYDALKREGAAKMLDAAIPALATEIAEVISKTQKRELAIADLPLMEEVPLENTPEAKNFRAPIPYRRLKPEYTAEAAMFDVAATVDMVVDVGASGIVMRTQIIRWAGFGLDESVDKGVRSMNWRPAMRDGKPLPMRFLVRYNFKKLEKDK